MNDGPQDLSNSFKQPRSRRGRVSATKARERGRTGAEATKEPKHEGVRTRVEDLQPGDVWKGWYGRQVVLARPIVRDGLVIIEFRKVRKDRSIIQSGESVTTTLKQGAPVRVLDHINSDLLGESRNGSTSMAKVTRKGGTAAKGKTAGKGKTAAKKESTSTRRSAEEVDALVDGFVEHLQGGGTMRDLKKEHGFSDDGPIRAALYRNGYDSKGNEHGEERGDIDASKVAGKKALLKLRQEGYAWFVLAYRADITETEAKKIIADQGGPTGRVYREPKEKPAAKGKTAGKGKGKGAKAKAADPS
jgi:hypothetical protein